MLTKNRCVRTSLALVSLLMMLALVLTGCGTDELEAKIDGHITQAEADMESASQKSAEDLAAAAKKAEEDLAAATKKAAEDVAAAKSELATVRSELEAQLAKLNEAQTASSADVAETEKLLKSLSEKLSEVETLCENLETSGATDKELSDALTELEAELAKSVNAAKEASVSLDAWDKTTELLIESLLAELDSAYNTYAAKKLTYSESGFAKIHSAYSAAYVRLMRASTEESAKSILASFKETASGVLSIADEIYDKLMEAGKSVDDITLEDGKFLGEANDLLEAATSIEDVDVSAAVLAEIESYGEDSVNLSELYKAYNARYSELLRLSNGADIKAAMDEALAKLITPDTELDGIYEQYKTWVAEDGNDPENVEGFADTITAFEAAMERVEELKTARTEAEELNTAINTLNQNITLNGASIENQTALAELSDDVDGWVSKYFCAPYDTELPTDTENGSANYNMVRHDIFAQVKASYEAKVEAFVEAAKDFEDALNAIPETVDLLSNDEIEAAWAAYRTWIDKASLGNFDYIMIGEKTPADCYDTLLNKTAEYEALREEALESYNKAYAEIDGVITYDEEKIDAILEWYDTYGVKDADGKLIFENGDVDGYVLSDTLTVGEEDLANTIHEAIEALEAKSSYKDFADEKESAEYQNHINAINKMIDTFKAYNGGDLEGNISDEEFAKLEAGALAVSKYNFVVSMEVEAEEAKATVNATSLNDTAKAEITATVDDVLAAAKADIDAIEAVSDGETVAELAGAKLNGIADTSKTYAEKLAEASDETAKSKLAISYANSLERIANAETVDSVTQYVGLVASELDAALSESN